MTTMGANWVADQEAAERAAAELRSTAAVRERSRQILTHARHGESRWFSVDEGFMESAVREVVRTTRKRYGHHVPFHSRWRHFEAGGVDRKAQLDRLIAHLPHAERARSMIDLAVVSVLLDAGAGPDWKYVEPATGKTFERSEGLAVASFHAFTSGLFSSDTNHPFRVDSTGLRALVSADLAEALQVSDANPLVGLDNRAVLMRRLGEVMAEQPEIFELLDSDPARARPSGIFDLIVGTVGPDVPPTADVAAHDILSHLLISLSPIWPSGNAIGGIPLGDCWRHAGVRGDGLSDGWVPFHKLSQWLAYSLLEPFAWSGVKLHGLDALTALPEYRNGGLLLDSGVLRLKDEGVKDRIWHPADEIVVEWRALTVALLDELAPMVRKELNVDEARFPLACVLEGGTWAAGRELAQRNRNGLPPLSVASDGTVF
ncbi:MAG TPA: URC4/urg3 family protein [Ramlibacter sp.]|uniref:URC4/urg3 family protein n=1 Tax=Ramlibacter sp. TaxID=1917967 RepID=UPI002CE021DC|nr:URC4/urg3 family protein [Ramlibacter sp.]HVZ46589.1 URC4/urg3 family protein [Ramlibacter sp.]